MRFFGVSVVPMLCNSEYGDVAMHASSPLVEAVFWNSNLLYPLARMDLESLFSVTEYCGCSYARKQVLLILLGKLYPKVGLIKLLQ